VFGPTFGLVWPLKAPAVVCGRWAAGRLEPRNGGNDIESCSHGSLGIVVVMSHRCQTLWYLPLFIFRQTSHDGDWSGDHEEFQ
jgi:hypothetical protein